MKKQIDILHRVKRYIYDTPYDGRILYPLSDFIQDIVAVKVDNLSILIKIVENEEGRFLDISPYKNSFDTGYIPKKITILVDKEEVN